MVALIFHDTELRSSMQAEAYNNSSAETRDNRQQPSSASSSVSLALAAAEFPEQSSATRKHLATNSSQDTSDRTR